MSSWKPGKKRKRKTTVVIECFPNATDAEIITTMREARAHRQNGAHNVVCVLGVDCHTAEAAEHCHRLMELGFPICLNASSMLEGLGDFLPGHLGAYEIFRISERRLHPGVNKVSQQDYEHFLRRVMPNVVAAAKKNCGA